MFEIPKSDRDRLRSLARRVKEIADLPIQEERRERWRDHNDLKSTEPMILIFPEGSWNELLPGSDFRCESDLGKSIEEELMQRLYSHDNFQSDNVVDDRLDVFRRVENTGWGLVPERIHVEEEKGAWHEKPVLLEPSDIKKMKLPRLIFHEKEDKERFGAIHDALGDILTVELKGVNRCHYHLMQQYNSLRGVEQTFLDMYEHPGLIHDVMQIFVEGHRGMLQTLLDREMLELNNDATFQGSGGYGFTRQLPTVKSGPVQPGDVWASAESQEMAAVSPAQHRELAMEYEKQLLEPFGLNAYGCCDPLDAKLEDVFAIPGIRRISISPWANVEICSEKLEDKYVYSWKPAPHMLVGGYDPQAIKTYLEKTLETCRGNVLEIVLKDTHTVENRPERMIEWSRIARTLADRYRA